jgi:predicted ribosome quality control (RQC) complex YloA/Tae2 family protein
VLTRLAIEWSSTLVGTRLRALSQESGERFRLVFASGSTELSVVVCLDPKHPWIGAVVRRWEGPRWSPDPFVALAARALAGRRLDRVVKDPADRTLRLDLGEGRGLVIELAPHGANLILVGEGDTVVAALHRPKGARERLTPGRPFSPRGFPTGRLDPFRADPEAIDAALAVRTSLGESTAEALQRHVVGVGSVGAALVVEEHLATGRSAGTILRRRLDEILRGAAEVLIEGQDDPSITFERGAFDAAGYRLLPWRPLFLCPGRRLFARDGPAATAAFFHEARGAAERVHGRIVALGGILRGELSRAREAERKVREALRSFEDPERHGFLGEALLASLSFARRSGEVVIVPDPYDPGGREIAIPAPPNRSLAQVADDLFQRQRRSRRGLAEAGARAEALLRRASRLEALLVVHERAKSEEGATGLEAEMRAEGIPVGLVKPTRAARAAAWIAGPRLDGVRMITSGDGWTILVGRTGRDNDRLTFKIAAPDDIWLHAAGVPGAHVVIRNPDRRASAPAGTLAEAARLALWFSEARSEGAGDVQWTRRKNVRRARGGSSGMVILKRFETIRVRAQRPTEDT